MRDAAQEGLAVGFFDGVHLGHRAILRGACAALTFRNHPLTVLSPERAPRLIMSPDERVAAIRACGVADVRMIDFTRETADMSPERFVAENIACRRVRCGANWRFGKGGVGDAAFLRARGIAVDVIPYAECGGEPISSSRIRAAIECGAMGDVAAMLGRRYCVSGRVEKGKGIGTGIGYPTLNMRLDGGGTALPPRGVYVVESAGMRGVANYGLAPTMGARAWKSPVLEVHFTAPDARERLSGLHERDAVCVELVRFVRPERKFGSVEELRAQIARDVREEKLRG